MSEFKERLKEIFAWIIVLVVSAGLVLFASYLDDISPWFGYVVGGAIVLITLVYFVNWLFIEPFRKRCRK